MKKCANSKIKSGIALSLLCSLLPLGGAGIPDKLRDMAAAGDSNAQVILAGRYFNGASGYPADIDLAVYWYRRAAAAGNSDAQYALGIINLNGIGMEQNREEAWNLIRAAAATGHNKAMVMEAVLTFNGIPQIKDADPESALDMLARNPSREAGITFAGLARRNGSDSEKAFARLDDLAGNNDPDGAAAFLLSEYYRDGFGCRMSDEKEVELLRIAAEKNHLKAKIRYAEILDNGFKTEPDREKAHRLLQECRDSGSADGITAWARHLLYGCPELDSRPDEAFRMLESVVDKTPENLFLLGRCHELGAGTGADAEKAYDFYRNAAETGNPDAQYACGRCLENGIGTEPNRDLAVLMYQMAAEQKHIESIRELGRIIIESGENIGEGLKLLKYAAEAGDAKALMMINQL